jgi:YegS/Rv2252/BmrU family lipid kinase
MQVTSNPDKWSAIVNSFAASSKAASLWRRAEDRLRSDGIYFETYFTGESGNATTLAYNACSSGCRKLLAVGGDGTVHDVLGGIMAFVNQDTSVTLEDFTLAVIPVGSGNDWIKTAGVPKDIVEAAALLKNGTISKQDVVKVSLLDPSALPEQKVKEVSYMANIGGVGLDARVCEMVNAAKKQGKRGKILYLIALIYNIIHRSSSLAKVVCDGKEIFTGAYLSMAFGIGKYSGGGMRQTPGAVPDDGFLDMTIIPDLPLLKIAKEASKLFDGRFLTVPELVTARSKSILVLPEDDNALVEVDGEVIGLAPVRFDILEHQLNILIP